MSVYEQYLCVSLNVIMHICCPAHSLHDIMALLLPAWMNLKEITFFFKVYEDALL